MRYDPSNQIQLAYISKEQWEKITNSITMMKSKLYNRSLLLMEPDSSNFTANAIDYKGKLKNRLSIKNNVNCHNPIQLALL